MIHLGHLTIEVTEAPEKKLKLSVRNPIVGMEYDLSHDDLWRLVRYLEKTLTEVKS